MPTPETVLVARQRGIAAAILGLETPPVDDLAVVNLVRRRLHTRTIGALQGAGVDPKSLSRIIPRRTLEHRRQKGEALSLEESERAWRTASTVALAEAVFGNRDKALAWLTHPKARFSGETPMDLIDTEMGARLVEDMLIQIDEGFFT
jgi:putative toxin-antitoxin system antitoxin component (TIGR02293 family)